MRCVSSRSARENILVAREDNFYNIPGGEIRKAEDYPALTTIMTEDLFFVTYDGVDRREAGTPLIVRTIT